MKRRRFKFPRGLNWGSKAYKRISRRGSCSNDKESYRIVCCTCKVVIKTVEFFFKFVAVVHVFMCGGPLRYENYRVTVNEVSTLV